MTRGKKALLLILGILVAGGVVLYNVDFGGNLIAHKAGEFVANEYGMGVSIQGVGGNPFKGYTLEGIQLNRDGAPLLDAQSLFVRPNLLKSITGNVALSWVELRGVTSTFEKLRSLAEVVAKTPMAPLPDFLPKGPVELKSLGGSLDGSRVEGEMDVVVSGFPVKGTAQGSLGDVTEFKKAHLELAGGTIDFSGKVMPNIDMTVKVADVDLTQLGVIVPQLASGVAKGRVSAQVTLGGTPQAPMAEGTVSLDDGAVAGVPLSFSSQTSYGNDALRADPLTVAFAGVPMQGHVAMDFSGKAATTDISLTSQGPVGIDALRKYLPEIPADAAGQVEQAFISLSGPLAAPEGKARIAAKTLSAAGVSVTDTNVSADFNSAGQVKLQASSNFAGAPIGVNGTLSLLKNPSVNLAGSVKQLDLAKVTKMFSDLPPVSGVLSGQVKAAGPLSNVQLTGTVSSPSVSASGVTVAKLNVPLAWRDGVLSLNGTSALVNGAPVSVSGSVSPLKGQLALSVTSQGLTAKSLSAFVPGLPKIDGAADLTAKVTGSFSNPQVELSAKSASLALDPVSVKGFWIATDQKLSVQDGVPSSLELAFGADRLVAAGVPIDSLTGKLNYDGQSVRFSNVQGSAGGSLSLAGSVRLSDLALDAQAELAGGDLTKITKLLAPGMVSGKLNAKASVSGTALDPKFSADFSSNRLVASGMAFDGVTGSLDGTSKRLALKNVKAAFGGAALDLSGSMNLQTLADGDFSVKALGVDLSKALVGFADTSSLGLSGVGQLSLDGKMAGGSYSGSGSLSVDKLTVAGFAFDGPASSIRLSGTTLELPDLHAGFYGGKLQAPAKMDLKTLGLSLKVSASDVDLLRVIGAAVPGLGGGLTGRVAGTCQLSGVLSPFRLSGSGQLTSDGGEVVGFTWVDLLSQVYGEKSLKYASAQVPFDMTTGAAGLTLKPGTQVLARDGDKIYRFIKATGNIGSTGALNLKVNGNLNAMAINVIFGAGSGALTGLAVGSAAGGLQGALGGALAGIVAGGAQGAKSADFRDVAFTVTGTTDSPKIKGLKVGPSSIKEPAKQEGTAAETTTAEPAPAGEVQKPSGQVEQAIRDVLSGGKQKTPVVPVPQPKKTDVQPESQPESQAAPEDQPVQDERPQDPVDQLKEGLKKELLKGVNDLFH